MKNNLSPEDRWIKRWTAPFLRRRSRGVRYGLGHDCAVLCALSSQSDLVLKTDTVVEGVHFTASTSPVLIGRKALARPLSDLAAAGAIPKAALVTVGCSGPAQAQRLIKAYRGLARLADKFKLAVVGGETVRTRQFFLSVALCGQYLRVVPPEDPEESQGITSSSLENWEPPGLAVI